MLLVRLSAVAAMWRCIPASGDITSGPTGQFCLISPLKVWAFMLFTQCMLGVIKVRCFIDTLKEDLVSTLSKIVSNFLFIRGVASQKDPKLPDY